MNFINLIWMQMKRIIKTPVLVATVIIMPLVVNFMVIFLNSNSDTSQVDYVIHIEDEGEKWQSIISEEFQSNVADVESMEEHFEKINNGELAAVYLIPRDFSSRLEQGENPEMIRYTREGTEGDIVFEASVQEAITGLQLEQILIEYGVGNEAEMPNDQSNMQARLLFQTEELDTTFSVTIILLLFYILMNASFISSDMISFKKNNVLQRMVVSPNRDYALIASMIVAYTIFLFLTNLVVLLLSKWILGFVVSQMPLVITLLFVTCIFSLSLAFALFRIFNHEGIAQLVGMFYGIGSFFITMLVQTGASNRILEYLSWFTPMYWVLEALDRNQFFPHVWILLLMAFVFVTAGSYRLRDFIKK